MRHLQIAARIGLCLVLICSVKSLVKRKQRSVAHASLKTWPRAVVPYVIGVGTNTSDEDHWSFTDLEVKLIHKAMSTIEDETCVRFVDVATNHSLLAGSYIEFVGRNEKYCHAQLGVVNDGRHEVILSPLCRSFGQILHELAHALGLMHEVMRPDRDDYIVLHEENILPEYLEEFRRLLPHQAQMWTRPFDFQSVTLYDPFTFSANSKPVWEPRKPLADTPLFSLLEKDLSFEDAAAINILYKCGDHCSKRRAPCQPDEFLSKSCRCETRESYAFRRCKDDRTHQAYCNQAIEQNKCYDETRLAVPFCRKTCGRCFRSGIFGRTIPPQKVCRDLEPEQCSNFVKEGYCYFDAWTQMHCQKSCNLCPPPRIAKRQVYNLDARSYLADYQQGKCTNRFDDLKCQIFANRGDCELNPTFMSSYCASACNICKNVNMDDLRYLRLNTAPCRNYIDDERCDALAREGKCHGVTMKQCLGSCNQCGSNYHRNSSKVTATPIPPRKCRDQTQLCPRFVELGDCEHKRELMQKICEKSCGFCKGKCEDYDPPQVCADVVKRHYCLRSGGFAERCAKSCGLCSDTGAKSSPHIMTGASQQKQQQQQPQQEENQRRQQQQRQIMSRPTVTNDVLKRVKQAGKNSRILQMIPIKKEAGENNRFAVKSVAQISVRPKAKVATIIFEDLPCRDAQPKIICRAWARSGYCAYSHVSRICRATCTICEPV